MTFFEGRRVLVTGSTGLVGWWLSEILVRRGAEVAGLERDPGAGVPPLFDGLRERIAWFRGSVERAEDVEAALRGHDVDTVFHLAAQSLVGPARERPAETFETNIKGTWTVLDACRRHGGVSRVVVASSGQVYGFQEPLPHTEDRPLLGRQPYEVSKIAAELIAASFHRSYGLPVAITRSVNVFGAGDLNESRIVPGTIRALLAGRQPVIRSDGSPIREYIHVEDLAEGTLRLAERLDDPEIQGRAFNFGTGEPQSVLELTRLLAALCDRPGLEPIVLDEVREEVRHHSVSSELALRLLDWKPRVRLEPRLQQTVRWHAGRAGSRTVSPR